MDNPFRTITMNGHIISEASGVDNAIAERAVGMGSLGAGIFSSGPIVSIVVPKGQGKSFAKEMNMRPEKTILQRRGAENDVDDLPRREDRGKGIAFPV